MFMVIRRFNAFTFRLVTVLIFACQGVILVYSRFSLIRTLIIRTIG